MKSLKKSLVTLLACTMAIAPCMVGNLPASAATIDIEVTDSATHTYEAYQLFKGDLEEGVLCNIKWGTGVNDTALLDALKRSTLGVFMQDGANIFTTCGTAEAVAGILEANQSDAAFADAFAEIVAGYLAATPTGSVEITPTEENKVGTINLSDPGYYFVKDADGSLAGQEYTAYTRFILQVLGDEDVTAKSVRPTLQKQIVEGQNRVEANTASIGEDVHFELTSAVPDMDGYNKYYFVVNDTLSSGLTFNADPDDNANTPAINITIGGAALTWDDDYYYTHSGGQIKIVIRDFVSYANRKDASIVITYSATLNENANLGAEGNDNIANLTYSNDPNYEYVDDSEFPDEPYVPDDDAEDDPETPGDETKPDPTGDTPDVETKTYATSLQIIKVDGENKTTLLDGATFKLEKQVNGAYVPVTELVTGALEGDDDKGLATFKGLGEGTYRITESDAPAGYNGLTDSIIVTLDATATVSSITWEDDRTEDDLVFENNTFKITIENNKGSSLPTTGGMGTTLIYVLGGMLVLCSIVLIITRKRMEYRQF